MLNKAAVKLHAEKSKKAMIGKSGFSYMGPKAIKIFENSMRSLAKNKSSVNIFELINAKGKTVHVELNASLVTDINDVPLGIIGVFRDISERYLAAQALIESEEKFKTLAEQSPNMIFINQMGPLKYVNKKCIEIMGYTEKEFLSAKFDFQKLIAPEDRTFLENNFKAHMKGKEVKSVEYSIITKSKQRIYAILSTKLIDFQGKKAILGVLTNMSEQKKAESEIQQAQKLASIGQFTAGLAHEINNPLSALSGELQWLIEKYDKNKKTQLFKSIDFMYNISNRIEGIVNNLLVFSREADLKIFETADINTVIKNTFLLIERRFKLNNIKIIKKYNKDLPDIKLNRGKIQQVILNILMNSFYAMTKGGILEIKTKLNKNRTHIEIHISDNGMGIPKKNMDKLFDPFFTSRPPGEGTGLGLSVSHGIISAHKGTISISSKLHTGTFVCISLPIKAS